MEIREAASAPEFAVVRDLIEQYAQALGVDLKFQNFAHEIRHLSEVYGPPRGCLLLAHQASQAVGCVELRGLGIEVCEMKRLYVRAGLRGSGIGKRLVRAVIDRALLLGYRRMVLDTLASMHTALALYRSFGFRPTESYYPNPFQDATFLELDLASSGYAA
ncbi:MAG: GNAT family N-acetyltransferase [Gammaproteobacteria bacterium]